MPKATDITGAFRVPEDAWGRFWNMMLTIPGADVVPNVRVQTSQGKRANGKTSEGSTGKCLVLKALEHSAMKQAGARAVMVAAGKSPKSVPNVMFELKRDKLATLKDGMYVITAKGRAWHKENCKG